MYVHGKYNEIWTSPRKEHLITDSVPKLCCILDNQVAPLARVRAAKGKLIIGAPGGGTEVLEGIEKPQAVTPLRGYIQFWSGKRRCDCLGLKTGANLHICPMIRMHQGTKLVKK